MGRLCVIVSEVSFKVLEGVALYVTGYRLSRPPWLSAKETGFFGPQVRFSFPAFPRIKRGMMERVNSENFSAGRSIIPHPEFLAIAVAAPALRRGTAGLPSRSHLPNALHAD